MSGRPPPNTPRGNEYGGDGGDSPAWTNHRERYVRPPGTEPVGVTDLPDGDSRVPYAELHCHSNFSFLDGASHPEELVEQAAALGLDALAITDHDGMYGVVRFADAAREFGMRTVFGTELSIGLTAPQNGVADPEGEHLLLLAESAAGYAALCRAITDGQLAGYREPWEQSSTVDFGPVAGELAEKGRPIYHLESLAADVADQCVVLTGCRKGAVRRALVREGPQAARRELGTLVRLFGADRVHVELIDHGLPTDSTYNDVLAGLAAELHLPTVATNNVHYARPRDHELADTLAAIRARRSLEEMDGWLAPAGTAHLRSGAEMAHRFVRYPGAVRRAALLGVQCSFDLTLIEPQLPPFDTKRVDPDREHTEGSLLRQLTYQGSLKKYGPQEENVRAYRQIEHELTVIEGENFPGYFLIVWDIVDFCKRNGILCQGRGSAANSAVCYALGITRVDPVDTDLLFERFLAPERDGPPDIDVDIESDRREEVIQYVYERYGRRNSAQVANVITYRSRFAVRDTARALGYSPGQQDAWSKQIDRWGPLHRFVEEQRRAERSSEPAVRERAHDIPDHVLELAARLEGFPRHLGIHSGGMVICDRPVSSVCPVEWARMDNRSVLQWDKDDCATAGLVKFDLLGLGMLSALHYMIDLVKEFTDVTVDMAQLNLKDQNVYRMLQRADSVGVFQVESRAQMATLPRLLPKKFYDLVVEVALIRPGPIQGGSVHPYIRRYNGLEKWEPEHELLKRSLNRTLGVPLFQEQMMQVAVDVANFSPVEADELRRAMGAKRSTERMARLKDRLFAGMADNGIEGELAEQIYAKLLAFSNFGFPESHALSFAHLVFASAHFKYYHPAAFCAALLRAQPMGFYSPQSLVADARRHGVVVLGPDINASLTHPTLEADAASHDGLAVRLGLGSVRRVGAAAEKIIAERKTGGDYADMVDLGTRVTLRTDQVEALATAGAFGCFGIDRRAALWAAGAAAAERPDRLPGTAVVTAAPMLPGMDDIERAAADVWAAGVSPDSFPTQFAREHLDRLGVVPADKLSEVDSGTRILIGGAVTHRQRPATAGGVTFLNIEDETGMVNVVCTPGLWARYRKIALAAPALLVRGVLEKTKPSVPGGPVALTVAADRLEQLDLRVATVKSRDFR